MAAFLLMLHVLNLKALALMSTGRTLTKNFGALSVIQVANFFIPFITLPFIVRVIGPDKFGLLNFLIAVTTYFILFINYGFDYTATRTVAQNNKNHALINETFSVIFFARLLLFVISAIVFVIILFAIPQLRQNIAVSIFCFAACFANVFFPNWLFQGMQQLQKAAVFNLVAKLIFCASIVIIIRHKEDYWWYAVISSLSQIIAAVILFIYAMRRFNLRLQKIPFTAIKETLYKDRMVFVSTLMINLYTTSNTVLLGFLKAETEVGIFTAAARIIAVVQTLALMPISQTLFPHIGSAFSKSRSDGLQEIKKVFPIVVFFTFSLSVLLFVFAPFVMHVLFGKAFSDSVTVLRILAFNPLIVCISNLLGTQTMLNMKMDKQYFRITCIGAVINLALNLLLTPLFSYEGTAIAWTATELCIVFIMAILLTRKQISVIDRNLFSWKYLSKINRHLFEIFGNKLKLFKH